MRIFKRLAPLALAGIFLQSSLLAQVSKQDKKEQERLNEVYGQNDPDFNITKAPDKWKNESAVILCQEHTYTFDKGYSALGGGPHVDDVELIRKRILLQDKAAVDEFSEFYFTSGAMNNMGIHIIKPGGKVVNVDVRTAVEVSSDTKIPSIFQSSYSLRSSYRKLAISGLEPGDILDYFYKATDIEYLKYYYEPMVHYSPILLSLNNVYPTVKQKILFEVERGFYINERSTNGAPQLKEQVLEKRNVKQFSLVDTDREKIYDERWSYEYRSTPTIKFQVLYPKTLRHPSYFVGETGVPKTSVSAEEVKNVVNFRLKQPYGEYYADLILKHLNKYYKKEKDPQVLINKAFYYFRFLFEEGTKDKTDINTSVMSDDHFTMAMARVLKAKKIDYKIMVAVAKSIGTLDDMILKDELYWFLKVEGNKPQYIYPFHSYSNLLDKETQYEGVDAYEIGPNVSAEKATISRVKVPASTITQNTHNETITATISEDMDTVTITRDYKLKGHCKTSYYSFIEYQSEYENQEKEMYHLNTASSSSKGWKGQQQQTDRAANIIADEKTKQRLEILADAVTKDFDLEMYEDFNLVQDGRQFDKQELIFNEEFKVKSLLKRAGNNYLMDVGKLIGSQIAIKEDEMTTRRYDIYISYPLAISYDIKVIIPEGYTIDGLAKLNVKVDNEAGSFIASATMEGTVLKIAVKKEYKESFEKKENWKKMTDFLDACYNFTQAKVVLKKKK